ncbi:MAG: L,D-transpeptidase family protein [Tissierellia bacterium]|nr:L,D-transpeptidase family protein [Tissierellia bacterium]
MKRTFKYMIIFLLFFLVMIYGIGVYFFTSYFMPKTTINGKDMSLTKISNLDQNYKNLWKDFSLEIISKESKELLPAQSFDYEDSLTPGQRVEQNPLYWFLASLYHKDYTLDHKVNYDPVKFKKAVDQLQVIQNSMVPPKNAELIYDGENYVIQKEVEGNTVEREKLEKALLLHLAEESPKVNLEEEDIYLRPTVYFDDEHLNSLKAQYDHLNSFQLTYDFEDRQEILKGPKLIDLYRENEEGLMVPDVEKVRNYVKDLAAKYDTFRTNRQFQGTGIGKVLVPGGIYGWLTDIDATTDHLTKALEKTGTEKLTPIYKLDAVSRKTDDIGSSYIEIDLARQRLWLYREGELVLETPVVTGNPSQGNGTPTGTGKIWSRERDRFLTGEDYKSYVHFWLPFNWSGCGVHDANWRSNFGGDIYKWNGSHGCVNTPPSVMKKLYDSTFYGMPVVVYDSQTQKIT